MFKSETKTHYTKKNNTHYYTKEVINKFSNGDKYILTVQRQYNDSTFHLTEYFYKERDFLNLKRTMMGKSKNRNAWIITQYNNMAIERGYNEDYKRFKDYFDSMPQPQTSIESPENLAKNFCKNTFNLTFHRDGLDDFFNLSEDNIELREEGNTGESISHCFLHNFFN